MNIVTVIPARSGSKSIPLKNIQPLNGKPLIAYSIEYSLKCPLISHTVVTTDSLQIAEIAEKCGAEVPFIRPGELAGDEVQDFPVIGHALNMLESLYRQQIDAVVWLRPTSPLRPPNLIERSIEILEDIPDCTSVRSVVKSSEHPYRHWRPVGKLITGFVSDVHEPYNLPRQQLPEVYFQSGDIEVVRRNTILEGSISGDKVAPLILEREEMLDIDHRKDLRAAEEQLKNAR